MEPAFLTYPVMVPWVTCATCRQVWGATALSYPAADVSALGRIPVGPLPPAEHEALRTRISACVGPDRPVLPGTQLGAPAGRLVRNPGPIDLPFPGTVTLAPEVELALRAEGLLDGCRSVATELRYRGRAIPRLVIELPVVECMPPADPPPELTCTTCGYQRWPRPVDDEPVTTLSPRRAPHRPLRREKLPGFPAFRTRETFAAIVSDALKEKLLALAPEAVELTAVELV